MTALMRRLYYRWLIWFMRRRLAAMVRSMERCHSSFVEGTQALQRFLDAVEASR